MKRLVRDRANKPRMGEHLGNLLHLIGALRRMLAVEVCTLTGLLVLTIDAELFHVVSHIFHPSPLFWLRLKQFCPIAKCSNVFLQVEKWVKRALEKGVDGLREEFMQLRRYVPPNMTCKAFEGTYEAGKSRYKDVPCQDQYRVVLKWPGVSDDYIHANYVGTPISKKRFICTQVASFTTYKRNIHAAMKF